MIHAKLRLCPLPTSQCKLLIHSGILANRPMEKCIQNPTFAWMTNRFIGQQAQLCCLSTHLLALLRAWDPIETKMRENKICLFRNYEWPKDALGCLAVFWGCCQKLLANVAQSGTEAEAMYLPLLSSSHIKDCIFHTSDFPK